MIKHLKDNGLNTIAYLPDPSNTTQVASVITDHGRFDYKEDSKKENEHLTNSFNKYDIQIDKDVK